MTHPCEIVVRVSYNSRCWPKQSEVNRERLAILCARAVELALETIDLTHGHVRVGDGGVFLSQRRHTNGQCLTKRKVELSDKWDKTEEDHHIINRAEIIGQES